MRYAYPLLCPTIRPGSPPLSSGGLYWHGYGVAVRSAPAHSPLSVFRHDVSYNVVVTQSLHRLSEQGSPDTQRAQGRGRQTASQWSRGGTR